MPSNARIAVKRLRAIKKFMKNEKNSNIFRSAENLSCIAPGRQLNSQEKSVTDIFYDSAYIITHFL